MDLPPVTPNASLINEESVDTALALETLAELTDVRVEPKVMAPVNVLTVYRRTPGMI